MLPDYFNYLTPIVTLTATYFYIKSIFRGQTIPNKVGWFIWMLAPLVASFIILKNGGGLSAIPVFMSWIIPLIVLLVSIKVKSKIKVSALDVACFFFALTAMYLWIQANNIYWATVFAIIADGLGFVPTIVKSWRNPETEKPWPYMSGIFSASVSLLTLKEYSFHLYGFPVYLVLGNLILILVIIRRK